MRSADIKTELKKTWGFSPPDSKLVSELKNTKGFSYHECLGWYLTSVRRGEIQRVRARLTDLQMLGGDPLETVGSDADLHDVSAALKAYAMLITEHKIRHAESKVNDGGEQAKALSSLLLPNGSFRAELQTKATPILRVLCSRELPSQLPVGHCKDPRGCQEGWLRALHLKPWSARFSLAEQMPDAKRKELEIKGEHVSQLPPPEVLAVAIQHVQEQWHRPQTALFSRVEWLAQLLFWAERLFFDDACLLNSSSPLSPARLALKKWYERRRKGGWSSEASDSRRSEEASPQCQPQPQPQPQP